MKSGRFNHSNKLATEFIQSHELDSDVILPWLAEQGGYCDCEILANVEESWEDDISDAT
ncbi:DUF2695 domain-containing protein [Alteromonas lipotrueae]|uniref:DUF2695 domain-containing protein n=1 Tax=Alteromonas lipotrueae TaxID=2803814 RepID=UPI001C47118C